MNLYRKKAMIVGALILFAYAVLASSVIESKTIVMLSETLSGLAVIGIAVIMFPLFKPYNKNLSVWYFVFRGIEGCLMIVAGFLLLSNNAPFPGIRDGIYVGHGYIFAVAALLFYCLLYISRLIPRFISVWGFIAAILLIIVNLLEVMGIIPGSMILYLPIISNEVVLAIWLIIKGFNPSAIASPSDKTDANEIK